MGHSDYKVLQRYVRLAAERDLGPRRDWLAEAALDPGRWPVGGAWPGRHPVLLGDSGGRLHLWELDRGA
jgi:hypothetical protein